MIAQNVESSNKEFKKNMQANVNEKIRAPRILLIDETGTNLGTVQTRDALYKAKMIGMDLVEMSNSNGVPVCKIMDYGKFKFEQSKKDKERARNQTIVVTKEIKFRPNTENNDLIYRAKQADEFLKEKNKIKISVKFRGREAEHISGTGRAIIERFLSMLTVPYNTEMAMGFEGKSVTILIVSQ